MALIIESEKCLACGVCAERCILDNIRVQIPPCRAACPVDLNPQQFVTLIALGLASEAAEAFHASVPFPRLLAYLCPAPCQKLCTRRRVDQAVAIHALERYLVDSYEPTADRLAMGRETGERVAVVGAGPAGMTAAVRLRQVGHEVVLLEAEEQAGGSARAKVPPEILLAETELLARVGVDLRLSARVGHSIDLVALQRDFPAILLAMGPRAEVDFAAHAGAELDSEGRLRVDPVTMSTSLRGLFAAGQMLTGVEHPVAAMGSAQKAVRSVDRYARGQSLKLPRILKSEKALSARVDARRVSELRRQGANGLLAASYVPPAGVSLEEKDADLAAVSCLRCAQPVDYYDECWYCLPCEVECPTNALILEIPFLVK